MIDGCKMLGRRIVRNLGFLDNAEQTSKPMSGEQQTLSTSVTT